MATETKYAETQSNPLTKELLEEIVNVRLKDRVLFPKKEARGRDLLTKNPKKG